jgi:hypothetical protein
MKKSLTGLTAFALFISACSKSTRHPYSASIVNKWSLVNTVYWWTAIGTPTQRDTANAHSGEYSDFRSDGKSYSYTWDGAAYSYDTTDYRIINGNSELIPEANGISTDTLVIKTLTGNSLSLYLKQSPLQLSG